MFRPSEIKKIHGIEIFCLDFVKKRNWKHWLAQQHCSVLYCTSRFFVLKRLTKGLIMGKHYGYGRYQIGDCDDCGAAHYGENEYDDHEEEPLCEECERYETDPLYRMELKWKEDKRREAWEKAKVRHSAANHG